MTLLLLILIALVVWCMHSAPAAGFYAAHVYPAVSAGLTRVASAVGVSLMEISVVVLVLAFIRIIVRAVRRRSGFFPCLWKEIKLLAWAFVWFYAAWGLNYFRSDIYARTGTVSTPYEEAEFHEFLDEFAEQLNANWCPAGQADPDAVEQYVKTWYAALPAEVGLCRPKDWQHPKRTLFNRLYSAVGVQGYIGPFFDEMHINRDVRPLEYPFVFAHEYSHVLGVSNEAEANFWAFESCRHSPVREFRYSAWFMLLTHTAGNIRSLLGDEAFEAWLGTLRPEILADLEDSRTHWRNLRWPWLSRLQHRFYNLFLRSNGIADGTKNYGQVLRLVLTLSDLHDHEQAVETSETEADGQKR